MLQDPLLRTTAAQLPYEILRLSRAYSRDHSMTRPVVTRFAPSPTGFRHIGGGCTAVCKWLYARRLRDRAASEAPAGVKPVIRLRAPLEGETVVEDHVQGRVTWQNKDLDDLVLLRSDGTPTFMLAVVVDDHDMGVTHVIRGDDHLTNAARQTQIYQACGWEVPEMAHIPLIHGPDGAKLS